MKRTQLVDAIRNIKRRFVSWLSISTIMMIGTTGFVGLQSVAFAMKAYGTEYITKTNLCDFEMVSSTGVSEEDLEVIRSLDFVNDAEGIISIESDISCNNRKKDITVYAMNDRVSIPVISDGKMPKEVYECALCLDLMEYFGLSLGDSVIIAHDPSASPYVIRDGKYIISGVVDSPQYMARGLGYYAVFPDDAINAPGLGNDYSRAYIDTTEPEDCDLFDINYYHVMKSREERLEALFDTLTELEELRIEDLKAEASRKGEEIPDFPEVRWHVAGRTLNASFSELTASYRVLDSVSSYFAPLFVLIAFMVCFSTITIIVEEQKSQIGTQKALGMSNRQVRAKYMLFGVSATVFGIVTGVFGAVAMEKVMNHTMADMYLFGEIPIKIDVDEAKLIAVSFFVFATFVIFISCSKMVRCSAVGLMNGSEPKNHLLKRNKRFSGKGVSIYIGLILRNIITDFSRVFVSVIIVLESVLMIGMGLSLNFGLWKAIIDQLYETWQYEMVIRTDGDAEHMEEIEEILNSKGFDMLPIHIEQCEASGIGSSSPVFSYLYAVDTSNDRIYDFYEFIDSYNDPVMIPEEGALITLGMNEKENMDVGEEISIVNSGLEKGRSKVSAVFNNNIGKYVILSNKEYKNAFGADAGVNSYLVKCDLGAWSEKELIDLPGVVSIEDTVGEVSKYEQLIVLFDIMVCIIILMVIMLAFMIQLNLSNIQVNRRMKDLLVMRVNGFSMPQVIGYLAREALLITIVGIGLGIAAGIPFASFMISQVEISDFMFVRGPFVIAWIISGGLCAMFSFVMNAIAYSRIRRVPVTNIL